MHLVECGKDLSILFWNDGLKHCRLYDKRAPIEAQYPSPRPSASQEYVKDAREGSERKILLHAPPG